MDRKEQLIAFAERALVPGFSMYCDYLDSINLELIFSFKITQSACSDLRITVALMDSTKSGEMVGIVEQSFQSGIYEIKYEMFTTSSGEPAGIALDDFGVGFVRSTLRNLKEFPLLPILSAPMAARGRVEVFIANAMARSCAAKLLRDSTSGSELLNIFSEIIKVEHWIAENEQRVRKNGFLIAKDLRLSDSKAILEEVRELSRLFGVADKIEAMLKVREAAEILCR